MNGMKTNNETEIKISEYQTQQNQSKIHVFYLFHEQ